MQDDGSAAAAAGIAGLFTGVFLLVWLAVVVLIIAGYWKTFEKAGKPGWAAIIPIYNLIVLAEVAGKPGWWGLLVFVPCVGFVFWFLMLLEIAKKFGQDALYAVLLFFFPYIMFPILGFGGARYNAAAAST